MMLNVPNVAKKMLNKQCIVFIIVRNIVMIFCNEFVIFKNKISKIGIIPSITYMNKNYYLERMLVHLLHFIIFSKNIIFYKVHN